MGRVAGVFDNPPGFPCTPPGVDILEGGKLTSNNVAGSSHDPLQSPAVASGAVSKPGGDTAGQDALHSAGVEGPEDSGARSKLPQPSQEEETLMCLLQHCICVSRPCEVRRPCEVYMIQVTLIDSHPSKSIFMFRLPWEQDGAGAYGLPSAACWAYMSVRFNVFYVSHFTKCFVTFNL